KSVRQPFLSAHLSPTNAMIEHVSIQVPVVPTARVRQVAGMFDLPLEPISRVDWPVYLPLDEHPWHVGLITGPSGCGKSTVARRLWPCELQHVVNLTWPEDESILDAVPQRRPIKDIPQ